jgi:hypothetical protein
MLSTSYNIHSARAENLPERPRGYIRTSTEPAFRRFGLSRKPTRPVEPAEPAESSEVRLWTDDGEPLPDEPLDYEFPEWESA